MSNTLSPAIATMPSDSIIADHVRMVWESRGFSLSKLRLPRERSEAIDQLAGVLGYDAVERMCDAGIIDGENTALCDEVTDRALLIAERDARMLWDEAEDTERTEASEAAWYRGGRSSTAG